MSWQPPQYGPGQGYGAPPVPYIPPPPPPSPKAETPWGKIIAAGLGAVLWGSCGLFVLASGPSPQKAVKGSGPQVDAVAQQDDADWDTAQGYAQQCRAPTTSMDCDGVKRYVDKWPEGRHVEEARAVLRASRDRITDLEFQERRPAASSSDPDPVWCPGCGKRRGKKRR